MTLFWVILLIIAALLGTPLFAIFGAVGLLAFHAAEIDSQAVIIELYRLAQAPTLTAIPLFTFAGYLLAESNAPARFVRLYKACFGWMPGGLAIVSLVACAFFTAFTGASGVTIVALGGVLYPLLLNEKYSEKFSLGLLTTGGSLGILFLPSLPLILYGLIASVDVDKLFLAGIVPGVLLVALLSLYAIFKNRKIKMPRSSFSIKEVFASLRHAIWEIPLPLIIIVGIYGGFVTVSEASVVMVVYVLFVETIITKDIKIGTNLFRVITESMQMVGSILIILGVALGVTSYLVDAQVPMKLFEFIRQFITNKYAFLMVLNIFLLVVGCMMDVFSAIIIIVPLIVPVAMEFGVNPVHLGIIFLANLEIGYSTPPIGLNLFISSYRFRKPITSLYRASVPYLIILFIALMIITYFPPLSLYLVGFFK
jgi:tripartite ATP-independent transporter DctM subunit